jgi:hypothetical protein
MCCATRHTDWWRSFDALIKQTSRFPSTPGLLPVPCGHGLPDLAPQLVSRYTLWPADSYAAGSGHAGAVRLEHWPGHQPQGGPPDALVAAADLGAHAAAVGDWSDSGPGRRQGGERGGRRRTGHHQIRLPARPQAQPGTLDVRGAGVGQLVHHRNIDLGQTGEPKNWVADSAARHLLSVGLLFHGVQGGGAAGSSSGHLSRS